MPRRTSHRGGSIGLRYHTAPRMRARRSASGGRLASNRASSRFLGATARAGWLRVRRPFASSCVVRHRLPPPRAGAHRAVPDRGIDPARVRGRASISRWFHAPFRGTRVPRLPGVRPARARLRPREVRRMPPRAPCRLLLQAARVLPELRRTTHGRDVGTSRRPRVPARPGQAVGAELPVPAPVPVRLTPRGALALSRRGPPRHRD
jgi:hypothetical protein